MNSLENFEIGQYRPEKLPVTYDIAPGASVEEVEALFFDPNALKVAPKQIYRLDRNGHRYYYDFDENGKPDFYPSITTIIPKTTPTDEFLIKWIAEKGYERAEEYKNRRAKYGTFMHGEFAEMLILRKYNLDKLKDRLFSYIEQNHLPLDFSDYADDLRKNMLSLANFMLEYKVVPIAVEMPLLHPYFRFGATLDLVAWITIEGKRELVIIDFKSGKGFYEANEVQLHAQKEVWNHHYPSMPVRRVFNWRPKDWRTSPTYHLCEQTDSINAEKLQYILAMAQVEDKKMDNVLTICDGIIDLDRGIKENYKSYTLAELVKRRKEEKTPEKKEIKPKDLIKTKAMKETPIKDTSKKRGRPKKENPGNLSKKDKVSSNGSKKPENGKLDDLLNKEIEI